ncbi:MAG TPA: GGDEF domain-containing protein [Terriglobales bacterium]|nr:GGDEF domain-containing protein [Terriglobales bacterium]
MPQSELKRVLRQLLWPNGTVVLLAAIAIASGLFRKPIAHTADYAAVAVIAAGLLTAWRFHAKRSIAGLLLFAGVTFAFQYANAQNPSLGAALSLLLPLNLVALLMVEEFTLSLEPIGYWAGFATVQAGVLAATCRPGEAGTFWAWVNAGKSAWPLSIGPIPTLMFALATAALLYKFVKERRPLDAGLAWSLLPSLLACHAAGSVRTAYLAAGAVAITVSVIETSYQLAYEDELTRLPGRRAFNQTIAALDDKYSIAMVDVDHFKKFNDTYGHEVGDQVLRMVASRLANVSGEGRPFRCGGEEFAVVFPGKSAEEAMEHAELLRRTIEDTTFTVRGPERSQRKRDERRYCHSPRHLQNQRVGTSVTVSIGVAQPRAENDDVHWVIEAADKALYAAKQRGRNRVVVATVGRKRAAGA